MMEVTIGQYYAAPANTEFRLSGHTETPGVVMVELWLTREGERMLIGALYPGVDGFRFISRYAGPDHLSILLDPGVPPVLVVGLSGLTGLTGRTGLTGAGEGS